MNASYGFAVVLFDPQLCGRLCLTLAHSLWQLALLAILAAIVSKLWKPRSVETSYAVHVAALLLGLVALPITFALVEVTAPAVAPGDPGEVFSGVDVSTAGEQLGDKPIEKTAQEIAKLPRSDIDTATPDLIPNPQAASRMLSFAPWFMACYAAGVALMMLRLALAFWKSQRIASRATAITTGPLYDALQTLARQWSVRITPTLAQAEQFVVPQVVGLLQPTILLPTSAITGLTTSELEMILAHELAHVRRFDMWINLVQRLAEAVLFFNPGLWFLSRRISTLREYCCDEQTCLVASHEPSATRLRYAQALLRVVELSGRKLPQAELTALAASGRSPSELRRRVARLFGEPLREPVRISRSGMLAFFVVSALLMVGPMTWQRAAETDISDATNSDNSVLSPISMADRLVAAARARSLGFQQEPKFAFHSTYWNAPVVDMQKLPDRTIEKLWKTRTGKINSKEKYESEVTFAWDSPKLVVRVDSLLQDGNDAEPYIYTDCHYWDGKEGWWANLSKDSRGTARYGTFAKLMDQFQAMYCPTFVALGNRLPWPGPPILIEHEVDPALTRYRHVGSEIIDNVQCDIFDGPARHERLWIEQSTGLIKAQYRGLIHQTLPDYYSDLVRKVAGRTFVDATEYRGWTQQQTPEKQAELASYWATLHWPLAEPGSLHVYSDYREVVPGVEWPMKCERLLVHYVGRTAADGFNYIRSEIVFDKVGTQVSISNIVEDCLPREGDTIWDRRAEPFVEYAWESTFNDLKVDTLRADAELIKQKKDAETQRINATPIESVADAIQILTEGPKTDPTEIWARAIKYLVDHKQEALPAVIAQLDIEQRDHPISKLAFALRAMGEPSAVPALIRALPRTLQPARSDYALILEDSALCRFMQQHDQDGKDQFSSNQFTYGRAFREVTSALHRLTNQKFGEMELNWVYLAEAEPQRSQQRKQFYEAAQRWVEWWEENWSNYVENPKFAKVNLGTHEANGLKFSGRQQPPTGPGVHLEEGNQQHIVQSVQESTKRCFIDLDTGREAGWPSSLSRTETELDSPELVTWARGEGFDIMGISYTPAGEKESLYCLKPIDMHVWKISEDEYRELEKSLKGEAPYPLSQPVQLMIPRREIPRPYDYEYSGDTFLFVTREGTAGVIRMTAQVTDVQDLTGQISSPSDQFSSVGFYRGAKIDFATMTEPSP